MKVYIVIFIVFTALSACIKENKISKERLSIINTMKDSSDILFSSKVNRMLLYNNKIYCIDKYLQQVLVIDKNLRLRNIIGEKGEGPYNFISINGIYISSKGIYILDAGNACMFLYTKSDSLIRIHNFSTIDRIIPEFKFIIDNDTSFSISTFDNKNAFSSTNFATKNNHFWGERFQFRTGIENRIRNGKNLLKIKNFTISISDNIPLIEIYDTATKNKIKEFDYSNITFISKQIDNESNNPHSYFVLCQDVYSDKNNLYILISEKKDNTFYTNLLLKFELKNNFELAKISRLPGKIYSTFCVSNDTIYAYNLLNAKIEVLK